MINRLKSFFVSGFSFFALVGLIDAAGAILEGDPFIPWFGVLLVHGAYIGLLVHLSLPHTGRTSEHLPTTHGVLGVGFFLAMVGGGGPVHYVSAVVGTVGTLLFIHWWCRFGRAPAQSLAVGQPWPSVELRDLEGGAVESRAALAGRPAVVLFIRGSWHPLCITQVRELTEQLAAFQARGAQAVVISAQPVRHTQKLAKRFPGPLYLHDKDGRACRTLGLEHADGLPVGVQALDYDADTVYPTALVVDAAGVIGFLDETDNDRLRPQPTVLLGALDRIRATAPLPGPSEGAAAEDASEAEAASGSEGASGSEDAATSSDEVADDEVPDA